MTKENRIIRPKELVKITGLSRSTIWRLENENLFPSKRQISHSAVGYLFSEIDEWMKTREQAGKEITEPTSG